MSTHASQTAVVSGASSGIGREIARVLALNGMNLVLVARNRARLTELADDLRSTYCVAVDTVPLDLFDPDAPRELFGQMQRQGMRVDVLVNNAGLGMRGAFADCQICDILNLLQLNVVSLTHLTRLFLPPMLQRHGGRILNVASIAAFLPGPLTAIYNASKAYVLSLSEALANELQGTGITVTALCPGPTRTRFEERAGVTHTRAFSGDVMDATSVAEAGYDAMMRGKRVVVPGARNKLRMLPIHLIPRPVLADFSRKYHEELPGAAAPNWLHSRNWLHASSWWNSRKKHDGYASPDGFPSTRSP